MPAALTIAGSDSSGGAGIQADLRTFAALEVYGASAITAVTSQNTLGVRGVEVLPARFVASQIDAVLDDVPIGAIKTGMLASGAVAEAVVVELTKCNVPIVVDPVMVAKSGALLLDDDAVAIVGSRLLPLATLVTPNLAEAERLVGFPVRTVDEQERAARLLVDRGAKAALVKGGHSQGDPVDVLFIGESLTLKKLTSKRIDTPHTHGTGCTYSAAIAAYLARGLALVDAVTKAHAYVAIAIETAPGIGRGHGPLHHMHPWYASTGRGAA
jgi:hydroxymethylpyrimidine/phosphomethylpyrimidine kinase